MLTSPPKDTLSLKNTLYQIVITLPILGMIRTTLPWTLCSYPEFSDEVVERTGIDINWIMYQLSVRKRRRVHIMIGLILPIKFILLDKIENSLDICVIQYLPCWIIKYSNERSATIICATQMYDGLD